MSREVPKRPLNDLAAEQSTMRSAFPVGSRVRHHSGTIYEIVNHTHDCKTNVAMMVYGLPPFDGSGYSAFNADGLALLTFTRPYEDFVEPRFTKVKQRHMYLSDEEYKKLKGEE